MNDIKLSINRWVTLSPVLFALFLVACSSQEVKPKPVPIESKLTIYVKNNMAFLSGVLEADLPQRLTEMVRQHPNVTDIMLVDVPGTDDQQATMEGARLIRRLGLNTHIVPTGYVLSGGVDLFLGGVERTIGAGAGVGVHAWSDNIGTQANSLNKVNPVHATYVNFYLEMGVSERFYWFSIQAAPANRIYFLSSEEIYDYQLVTE
ncbi:alpha/beta hydrolase [Marinomonas pollencensis]|uniref:Uncharacterized protein n=1 Tax=Marinomonas pollencensis TaxID=491954 RepID=A0A3E0DA27_9GAMM|nr:alpha/beta hydrolase [Marinomonas pollencensis]REG79536.1 hypothetical protein DFP81_11830 [Marinomonas pollencensis]